MENKAFVRGLLLGAAAGAGLALYKHNQETRHPLETPAQKRINAALDRALQMALQTHPIKLERGSKYVVFSDHHRGARDAADDFQPCEPTYLAAMDYYYKNGYTLVLLGDVEELLENRVGAVMESYPDLFKSEQRFYPERYFRVAGNHDEAWNDPAVLQKYLEPYYTAIKVFPSLVFEFDDGQVYGRVFLAHGHQGTLDSDTLSWFGPRLLPGYRLLQNLLSIGKTTPAVDNYLRSLHDTRMYNWASQKERLIFIAGHTHRPVWTSLTHLEQLYMDLHSLRQRKTELGEAYPALYNELIKAIQKRTLKEPPSNDTQKTRPCYFNTGCCRYADGDITGIEITNRRMRLVKWDKDTRKCEPLNSMQLKDLFVMLV